ncbi:hypothetical protein CYLTODRAFT_488088 [Cylindrobasidium torrendii FP15055 ss-10]|uniref:DUF7598 domain-containing protein n=1 Tax=Cylindrobasidium torrendii FP15055 ss-10 TaxID=1314674 RepID=A0A0D7BIM8_9AGAR|nr:hypothetical protein CYLTODRAFT_488088 [Cylindrobasidium torrendii FP15055 ss-10]
MPINTRSMIFYGLNATRLLSVVALVLVFASSITIMVKNIQAYNHFESIQGSKEAEEMLDCDYIESSSIPNQAAGVFWAVMSSLLIIFQTIVLGMSEFGWPNVFFERYFPVLGPNFGLGPLGIFQALIAAQILSHYVDTFPLVSAFFLFSVACINMLLGLVFRESAKDRRSITSWRDGDKSVLPSTTADLRPAFTRPSAGVVSSHFTGSSGNSYDEKASYPSYSTQDEKATAFGFGRQGEKAAGLKGFLLTRPVESLPRYASPSPSFAKQERPASPVPSVDEHGRKRMSASSDILSIHSVQQPNFKSSPSAL